MNYNIVYKLSKHSINQSIKEENKLIFEFFIITKLLLYSNS